MSTELAERNQIQEDRESKQTLALVGGAALVVFGAGLILSTPAMRGLLGGLSLGDLVGGALPKDIQRYMRMRAM